MELQVPLDKGEYASSTTVDERHQAAARSAIFLVAHHLVKLGFFLGSEKSVLRPSKVVPYLGFLADSSRGVFHLKPDKKQKFLQLVWEILDSSRETVKTLQRLVGKCVPFSLAVPAARLFTKQINSAIARGQRSRNKLIPVESSLHEEISHWLFLENRDDPLPWRDESHIRVSIAADASASGWDSALLWDLIWDFSITGLMGSSNAILQWGRLPLLVKLSNARVDALVDNKAVVEAWNNQGGRSLQLNAALKRLLRNHTDLTRSLLAYSNMHMKF